MNKSEARTYGQEARKNLTQEQREEAQDKIFQEAIHLLENCTTVCAYASLAQEVSTDRILQWCLDSGHTLLLPRTQGKSMQFYKVERLQDLVPGRFHVREPERGTTVDPCTCDVILVPCSAVDAKGNRVGYGKGYYDSVLSSVRNRVGLCFDVQIVEEIEADPWDVPLDYILTESGLHAVQQ